MKEVIVENKIASLSVSSEDATGDYVAANMLNIHTSETWRATTGTYIATLTCEVLPEVDRIGIANTNAVAATVAITSPVKMDFGDDMTFGDDMEWAHADFSATSIEIDASGDANAIYVTLPRISVAVQITITLVTQTGNTLYAGIIRIGEAIANSAGPNYGIQESYDESSIVEKTEAGSWAVDDGEHARTFALTINLRMTTENEFLAFMRGVYEKIKLNPAMMRLVVGGFEWVVFARFVSPPTGSHSSITRTPVTINLIEAK